MAGSGSPGSGFDAPMISGVIAESPVIGEGCFNVPERVYAIRTAVPLTAEMLVAAIYGEREDLFYFDIADTDDLWESIASALVKKGFDRIEDRALAIREERRSGTVAAPEWLELCRRRVADLISDAWQAARRRCPCGYATDDDAAFAEHLNMAGEREPVHLEVTETVAIHCFWEREPLYPRAVGLDDPLMDA